MRNKGKYIFYTLFLITAGMFEAYCLLELRQDLISLICGGIVLLIAAYLFIDMIIDCYRRERALFLNARANEQLHNDLQELIKYEKALIIINKKVLDQKGDV